MDSSRIARTVAVAAAAVALAGPATADAATRYVKQGGVNTGNCLSSGTACTYSRALNAGGPSQPGDTVMVLAGTYDVSPAEIYLTKQLHVVGQALGARPVFTGSDPNQTTIRVSPTAQGTTLRNLDIRAEGSQSTALWAETIVTGNQLGVTSKATCVYLDAPGSTLENSTALGTSSSNVCVSAGETNTKLRNVDVTQGNAFGTALYFGGSGSSAEDLFVISSGAGAYFTNIAGGQRVVIRRSVVSAAAYNGATTAGGPVLITDSFLRSNGAGGAALSVYSYDTQVRNVTAIAAGSNSHAMRVESAPPGTEASLTARNAIARGAQAGIVIQPGKDDPLCIGMGGSCIYPDHVPGTAGRSHSNVGSVVGGVQDLGGNKSGNPLFRNTAMGDYRLSAGSPAIDAGTADPDNGTLDYYGLPRTLGAAPDMGAYEFDPGAPPGDPPAGPMPPGGDVPEEGPGNPGGPGQAGADTTTPFLVGAGVTNRVFARTGDATPVSARAKRGTAFRYTLSEAAVVTIAIDRRATGRRSGRRCVKPTRRLARAKRCTRYVAAGKLTRASQAGPTSVPFSGRIGKRALPIGTYRVRFTARDMAGNRSEPAQVAFRIVRR